MPRLPISRVIALESVTNNPSALNDELKLGEDNSDVIEVPPKLIGFSFLTAIV